MILIHFQGKPFNITVIQIYAPTINAKEAEVDWFHEELQDLLELTPKKDVPFITGDWNAKTEEILGVTSKFGMEYKMKQGNNEQSFAKRTYWSQQTYNKRDDTTRGYHQNQIDYTLCSQRWSSSIK